jgi:predicted nucleic acid-binding protein
MRNLFLFDTNILAHLVRNDATGEKIRTNYLPFMAEPKPFICTVSEGELRSLALQWAWGRQKTEQMGFVLGYFRRVSIERTDATQVYATIDALSQSQGIRMGTNDLWIAAAAHIAGARLVTTDDDFDHLMPSLLAVDKITSQ